MDRLAAVADPELRATLLHVRANGAGVTADDTAESLDVHRNVARGRLERLAAVGLVDVSFERRTGRSGPGAGRPAKVYRAAPETTAIEFPPRHLVQLVSRLVDEVPPSRRARALRRAGEDFGRELAAQAGLRPARGLRAGVERLCAALRRLGFEATPGEVTRTEAVVRTATCPLRPLVLERPETAEIDRGMWSGLLAAATGGVRAESVRCDTADCFDHRASCAVVLRLQEARDAGEIARR